MNLSVFLAIAAVALTVAAALVVSADLPPRRPFHLVQKPDVEEVRGRIVPAAASATDKSFYMLGKLGETCTDACFRRDANCRADIKTDNSSQIFERLGVTCKKFSPIFFASDQPSYDPSTGATCLGFANTPAAIACQGRYPTTQRVCRCAPPTLARSVIGTSISQSAIGPDELPIFAYVRAPGMVDQGVLSHLWITPCGPDVVVRYYVDNETTPSLEFNPDMAIGLRPGKTAMSTDKGNFDAGGGMIGKLSTMGAQHWDVPVPFNRKIRVTVASKKVNALYAIVRGVNAKRINFDFLANDVLSSKVKLVQQTISATSFKRLEFIDLLDLPKATTGAVLYVTMSIRTSAEADPKATPINFLEGCWRTYTDRTNGDEWGGPGFQLQSSGFEDMSDSSYYYSSGPIFAANTGTPYLDKSHNFSLSIYRFFRSDGGMPFFDGIKLFTRNGELTSKDGIKCLCKEEGAANGGCEPNGNPTTMDVEAYAFAYVNQE